LRDAHNVLKTVEERTVIRDNGQCIRSAKKLAPRDGGIFVHLISDTPGEQASVIPKMKKGWKRSMSALPLRLRMQNLWMAMRSCT